MTVVPLSTTEPDLLEDHHHALGRNPLPGREAINCWAKCDMLTTVSLGRLDRYKVGRGQYAMPMVPADDFEAIRHAVAKALDLTHI